LREHNAGPVSDEGVRTIFTEIVPGGPSANRPRLRSSANRSRFWRPQALKRCSA
jgi:hypothetical protein